MAFADLKRIFDAARKAHPDLMEPYVILLEDAQGEGEQESVMRHALRETVKQRYPSGEAA